MKRLFSSLIIFSCFSLLLSLQGMQQPITTRYKEKKPLDLKLCEMILQEEHDCRNAHATSKTKTNKRQLHAKIDVTRPYFEQLLQLQNPTIEQIQNLVASYKVFNQFVTNQLSLHPTYQSTEQYKKDNDLVKNMHKNICSILKIAEMTKQEDNLTQSTLCINIFQSSSTLLDDLTKKRIALDEQMKQITAQMIIVNDNIEFEKLRQKFAREELQKQEAIKTKQVENGLTEAVALQRQIEQLTLQLQATKQQAAAALDKKNKMNNLINGWQGMDSENISLDDTTGDKF